VSALAEAALSVAALGGLWRRSLLRFANGGEDRSTEVSWLQGAALFADLRQPAWRPDFSHLASLADVTLEDCRWLATQQGFAGEFRAENGVFWWHREIDFQPPSPAPDAGRLDWADEVLVETGAFAPYLEHWHRAPNRPAVPAGGLRLRAPDGRAAIFVRAGEMFMLAIDRAPGVALHGASLAECVAAAPDVAAARAQIGCEISLGQVAAWRIERSTLPWREGQALAPRRRGGVLELGGVKFETIFAEGEGVP
jgi:hypothetical protein